MQKRPNKRFAQPNKNLPTLNQLFFLSVCSLIKPSTADKNIQIVSQASLTTEGEIFEIQTLNCSGGDSFLVRQKNQISINTICDGEIEFIHMLTSSTSPFMSSAQDELRRSRLITTDRHQNFKLWNLATSTAEKFQFDEKLNPTSSWNMIRFFQRDVFLFATKNKLRLYDTRTNPDENNAVNCHEDCGRFSNLSASSYPDLFHLATNHKLYTLDWRYLKREINEGNCVLKWAHQMDCCPVILKTLDTTDRGSEIFAGASPVKGDIRIFELEKVEKKAKLTKIPYQYFSSSSLAYMPPTLEKAYKFSRKKGIALNPEHDLEQRISYCFTGLDFYEKTSGDPVMLTSNSLGDVFASTLNFTDSKEEDVTVPIKRFLELLPECNKRPLYVTDKADFSSFRKVLNCPRLNEEYVKVEEEYEEVEKVVKEKGYGKWRNQLIPSFFDYKDVLAQDILSIWDVQKPDDFLDRSDISLPQQSHKNNIVSSWLQSSVLNDDSMVTIPATNITHAEEENEPRLTSTQLNVSKPTKHKKKVKTYIKGF